MPTKAKCPLTGQACWEHGCAWWAKVATTNLQTGAPSIQEMCQVHNIAFLLLDLLRNTGGTQAAVENLRNMVAGARPVPPNVDRRAIPGGS